MSKAIGMVEYKTTSAGVVAADSMVKTSRKEFVTGAISPPLIL